MAGADMEAGVTQTELRECPTPWCGHSDRPYVWQGPDDKFTVICAECQVEGPPCDTEAEAIAAWNHERLELLPVSGLLQWMQECWPKVSETDFNQGVVRGFEIIRAQLQEGHIQRYCAIKEQG